METSLVYILGIVWVVVFISAILVALGLSFYDAAARANGEKGIYPDPEDFYGKEEE